MPKKVIYTRYAFEDILVESDIEFNGYVEIKNKKGEIIASTNTYRIGDEDEDGNELLEDDQDDYDESEDPHIPTDDDLQFSFREHEE
jgi:hypothetical protein